MTRQRNNLFATRVITQSGGRSLSVRGTFLKYEKDYQSTPIQDEPQAIPPIKSLAVSLGDQTTSLCMCNKI